MKTTKILKINLIIASIITSPFVFMNIIRMISENIINVEKIYQIVYLIFAVFLLLNIISLPIYIVKFLVTTRKIINIQHMDSKESIYTRELPQEYNSAIAGEILDFKFKFKEEYVAGVIELISKGYIIEEKENLIVNNKKTTDNLLKNEKYILETCTKMNKDLYFDVSYEFFKKIREDMLDLGLYKKSNFFEEIKNRVEYYFKKHENNRFVKLLAKLLLFITFITLGFLGVLNFKIMFLLAIIVYIAIIIIIRKKKLTPKGEMEKEKVGKIKLFLDRETNFKDKTKEERKIWGRYSAFAVALGTNEKLKEEIYEKIIKNKN